MSETKVNELRACLGISADYLMNCAGVRFACADGRCATANCRSCEYSVRCLQREAGFIADKVDKILSASGAAELCTAWEAAELTAPECVSEMFETYEAGHTRLLLPLSDARMWLTQWSKHLRAIENGQEALPLFADAVAREKAQRIWEKVRHAPVGLLDDEDYGGAEFTSFCQSHPELVQLYRLWYRSAARSDSETAAARDLVAALQQIASSPAKTAKRAPTELEARYPGLFVDGVLTLPANVTTDRSEGGGNVHLYWKKKHVAAVFSDGSVEVDSGAYLGLAHPVWYALAYFSECATQKCGELAALEKELAEAEKVVAGIRARMEKLS